MAGGTPLRPPIRVARSAAGSVFCAGGDRHSTLAIALNVVAFTIMDAMLFRGYPLVRKNERLVYLQERPLVGSIRTTYLDFDAWRSQARAFEGMAFIAHTP